MSRCAVEQVALAFLLPLALALIHSVVGMKAANDFIAQAGKVDALQSTAVTALMLLVVYGGYFLGHRPGLPPPGSPGNGSAALNRSKLPHWPRGQGQNFRKNFICSGRWGMAIIVRNPNPPWGDCPRRERV